MKFEILDHAYTRLIERVHVKEAKHQKICQKAWNKKALSNADAEIKLNRKKYSTKNYAKNRVCKELMGFIFIFAIDSKGIALVTVI